MQARGESRVIVNAVYIDFDGTISLEDSTDSLLTRYADPRWLDVEASWLRGEIGSRNCLQEQVSLLSLTPAELDSFVGSVAIDPGFVAFLALCGQLALPVTVVSDGLDIVVQRVLRQAGIDLPVVANTLVHEGGQRWSLSFPHARTSCQAGSGNCKCATVGPTPMAARSGSVLIGDGHSDFCAAGVAGLVIAKGRLLRHCREQNITCRPFATFADITNDFAGWIGLQAAIPQISFPSPLPTVDR